MYKYDPKSLIADEFINDEEIKETLAYAEANKNNFELIDAILEKARPGNLQAAEHGTALTHREASVLLACAFRAAVSLELLHQWMPVLPVSCKE